MFHSLEFFQGLCDDFRLYSGKICNRHGSQGILDIMISWYIKLFRSAKHGLFSFFIHYDHLPGINKSSHVKFFHPAERNDFRFCSRYQLPALFIIMIYDHISILLLILKYPGFRCSVFVDVSVPVQVIRGKVQYGRDLRLEISDRLQLETGDFGHQPCIIRSIYCL